MHVSVPDIQGNLRKNMVHVPEAISNASGIRIFGRLIKSILFSTDVAIIKNCNANAVIAIYPFTPQPIITHAIIHASDVPVFCGVGGGLTGGQRLINLALDAEFQGAIGVVVNAPAPNETIRRACEKIDIPLVITIVAENTDVEGRLTAGATILNVSGAAKTAEIVKSIRERYPDVPVIATGGPTDDSIMRTIEAGANAITFTPPTTAEIFSGIMREYRSNN